MLNVAMCLGLLIMIVYITNAAIDLFTNKNEEK